MFTPNQGNLGGCARFQPVASKAIMVVAKVTKDERGTIHVVVEYQSKKQAALVIQVPKR